MPVIDLGSVVGPQGPQGATGATGAQGIQGNPGPNQVTDQTSTNLNGVLFGNQSRVTVKPVDATPSADSTNLVSSGGTKAALDTKANQGQLAYVENGTTATKTNGYAVGEYFCWHGLLYRAKTAIGNGDTFTENTNCEQVTVGADLYRLDNLITKAPGTGARDAQLQVGTYNSAATVNIVSLPSKSPGKPDVSIDFATNYIRVYYTDSSGNVTTSTYRPV